MPFSPHHTDHQPIPVGRSPHINPTSINNFDNITGTPANLMPHYVGSIDYPGYPPDFPPDAPREAAFYTSPNFSYNDRFQPEDSAPAPITKVQIHSTNRRKLGLQLPGYSPEDHFHRPPMIVNRPLEDLRHKVHIADEMLCTYLEKDEGRGLDIKKPRPNKSFFDMAKITSNAFSDVITLENNTDYFADINEIFKKHITQKSYVKSMNYDILVGRIDIDLETCYYTYSDQPFPLRNIDTEKKRLKSNLLIIVKSRANPIRKAPQN